MEAVFNAKPELENYTFNKADYDLIIIGFPLWASSITPPINTFLNDNDLSDKKLAVFITSGGGNDSECYNKLLNKVPNIGIKHSFVSVLKDKQKTNEEIEEFLIKLNKH